MKILSLLLFSIAHLAAQEGYFKGGTYNPAIPTPRNVLGYEIGERFTDFRNLERYLDKLSVSSDRIRIIQYGETYERRPLRLLVISSPGTFSRLESIKSSNRRLTDPRLPGGKTETDEILKTLPAIAWLSYGVHGNESYSPEAAIMTAYQLCAGTDSRTQSILDNLIVLIDPAVNPDGRERAPLDHRSAPEYKPQRDGTRRAVARRPNKSLFF